jgi:hypothetical protein
MLVRVRLLDENEELKEVVQVETNREYQVNSYFQTEDGDLWEVAEVGPGQPPIDVELTAVWIGPPENAQSAQD